MTTGTEKRASWRLDLDLDDVKKEFKGLGEDLRGVSKEITALATQTDQAATKMVNELKGVGTEIKTAITQSMGEAKQATEQSTRAMVQGLDSVEGAIKDLAAAWRQAKDETKSVGAQINQVLSSTKAQLTDVHKLVRQYNMTDWQKQADNYSTAIRKAQVEVNGLKKALAAANLEEKERLQLEQQLGKAQRNVGKLQTASKAHVALGVDADTERTLEAIRGKVTAITQATHQHGMKDWQKAAEGYNQALTQSKTQLDAMRQAAEGANISHKDRAAILAKIADGERQIIQLEQQSKVHVDQLRKAEEGRGQAVKATAADMRQAAQDLGLMSGALGAVLSKGLGDTLTEFGNFEEQILKFGAVSDATEAELAQVKDMALELGATSKFTAAEIGAAAVELAKMGFSAKETQASMAALVEASIASGESLDEVSTIVASTLRMFNMQASEAGKVSDIITRGANISAQSYKSFADSIRYVGSAAAASNQELTHIAGLLDILADRGIKGTQAGNQLQNALLRLQAPTKAAREAIASLNLAIADTKGTADKSDDTLRPFLDIMKEIKATFAERGYNTIKQADILKDLFGEVALSSMQVFQNTHNDVMDAVMAKQEDYQGSTSRTAEKMKQGWNHAVEEMKSAFNSFQISIGEDLAPALISVVKGVKEVLEVLNSLDPMTKNVIAWVGVLSAAIFTAFAGAAGVYVVVGKGTEAFRVLGTMMLTQTVPAANTTATALTGVGTAGKAAAAGGLAAFGLALGGLIVAGAAIWILLKAVKDLNDALDQLAESEAILASAEGAYSGRLANALKLEQEGKPVDLQAARLAAVDAQQQMNKKFEAIARLKIITAELAKLEKEQAEASLLHHQQGMIGALAENLARDGKIKDLKTELKLLAGAEEHNSSVVTARLRTWQQEWDKLNKQHEHFQAMATKGSKAEREKVTPTGTGTGDGGASDDPNKELKDRIELLKGAQAQELKNLDTAQAAAEREAKTQSQRDQTTKQQIKGIQGMSAELEKQSKNFVKYAQSNHECFKQFALALRQAEINAGILSKTGKVLKEGQSIWADIQMGPKNSKTDEWSRAWRFKATADRAVDRGLLEKYTPKSAADITPGSFAVYGQGTTPGTHVETYDSQGVGRSDFATSGIAQRAFQSGWVEKGMVAFYRYKEAAQATVKDVEALEVQHQKTLGEVQQQGFSKRIEALFKHRKQWTDMLAGVSDTEENKELRQKITGEIAAINSLLEKERGASQDAKEKIAKLEAKYEADRLKELQKYVDARRDILIKGYEQVSKDAASALDAINKETASLREANENALLSEWERAAKEIQQKLSAFDDAVSEQEYALMGLEVALGVAEEAAKSLNGKESQDGAKKMAELALAQADAVGQLSKAEQARNDYLAETRKGPLLEGMFRGVDSGIDEGGRQFAEDMAANQEALAEFLETLPEAEDETATLTERIEAFARANGYSEVAIASLIVSTDAYIDSLNQLEQAGDGAMDGFVSGIVTAQDNIEAFQAVTDAAAGALSGLFSVFGEGGRNLAAGVQVIQSLANQAGSIVANFNSIKPADGENMITAFFGNIQNIKDVVGLVTTAVGLVGTAFMELFALNERQSLMMRQMADDAENYILDREITQARARLAIRQQNGDDIYEEEALLLAREGEMAARRLQQQIDYANQAQSTGALESIFGGKTLEERQKIAAMQLALKKQQDDNEIAAEKHKADRMRVLQEQQQEQTEQHYQRLTDIRSRYAALSGSALDVAEAEAQALREVASKERDAAMKALRDAQIEDPFARSTQKQSIEQDYVLKNLKIDRDLAQEKARIAYDSRMAELTSEAEYQDAMLSLQEDGLNKQLEQLRINADRKLQQMNEATKVYAGDFDKFNELAEASMDLSWAKEWRDEFARQMEVYRFGHDEYLRLTGARAKAEEAASAASIKALADAAKERARYLDDLGYQIGVLQAKLTAGTADDAKAQGQLNLFNLSRDQAGEVTRAKGMFAAGSSDLQKALNQISQRFKLERALLLKDIEKAVTTAAADDLRKQAEALKTARSKLFESDAKIIEDQIKGEERALKLIDQQNEGIQKQIDLRRKMLDDALKAFDANDIGIFAQKKAGVDLELQKRLGLAEIANPEGVPTSTFSTESIEEAIRERIAMANEEAEYKFGLELYDPDNAAANRKAYLDEVQNIAAIEARAAEEGLKLEGLTGDQKRELMRMAREAYRRFQEAYREQLTLNAEAEADSLQQQIDANEASAQSHHDTIEAKKTALESLREKYEADLQLIDDRISEVLDAHAEWKISTAQLANGVKGPLDAMIKQYQDVKASAEAAAKAIKDAAAAGEGAGGSGAGGSAPPRRSQREGEFIVQSGDWWYKTSSDAIKGSEYDKAQRAATKKRSSSSNGSNGGSNWASQPGNKIDSKGNTSTTNPAYMATGGVIPAGFEGDRFPAMLESHEAVFPPWFTALIQGAYQMRHDPMMQAPARAASMYFGDIILQGDFRDPGAVRRELTQTINELSKGPSVNASYTSPLGI